jgi:hypothetical protein
VIIDLQTCTPPMRRALYLLAQGDLVGEKHGFVSAIKQNHDTQPEIVRGETLGALVKLHAVRLRRSRRPKKFVTLTARGRVAANAVLAEQTSGAPQ